MRQVKEWHCETLGRRVVDALSKNHFAAEYVATVEEARKRVLELVPRTGSVGVGGSMTISQLNILDELAKRGNVVLNHNAPGLGADEKLAVRRRQLTCDCFLSSANAVTLDGKLVNKDGTGNRVTAMIFGPQKVIIVVGVNKIVKDVDDALTRIETLAAPMNNKRLGLANPCTKTGLCMDCAGGTRICNVTTIIHKKPSLTDMTVLVVGEALGF